MMKFSALLLSFVLSSTVSITAAFARDNGVREQVVQGDAALVSAIRDQRNKYFLEADGLKVIGLLKDDTQGLPHQKFMVQTSAGNKVLCVYNLDKGQRIPLKIGDTVNLGGEFKWTDQGALMHWLHEDDSNKRPDGYVELAGRRYGLN